MLIFFLVLFPLQSTPESQAKEESLRTPSKTCPNNLRRLLHDIPFFCRFELDRFISLDLLSWEHLTEEFVNKLAKVGNDVDKARQMVLDLVQRKRRSGRLSMRELFVKYSVAIEDDADDSTSFIHFFFSIFNFLLH